MFVTSSINQEIAIKLSAPSYSKFKTKKQKELNEQQPWGLVSSSLSYTTKVNTKVSQQLGRASLPRSNRTRVQTAVNLAPHQVIPSGSDPWFSFQKKKRVILGVFSNPGILWCFGFWFVLFSAYLALGLVGHVHLSRWFRQGPVGGAREQTRAALGGGRGGGSEEQNTCVWTVDGPHQNNLGSWLFSSKCKSLVWSGLRMEGDEFLRSTSPSPKRLRLEEMAHLNWVLWKKGKSLRETEIYPRCHR